MDSRSINISETQLNTLEAILTAEVQDLANNNERVRDVEFSESFFEPCPTGDCLCRICTLHTTQALGEITSFDVEVVRPDDLLAAGQTMEQYVQAIMAAWALEGLLFAVSDYSDTPFDFAAHPGYAHKCHVLIAYNPEEGQAEDCVHTTGDECVQGIKTWQDEQRYGSPPAACTGPYTRLQTQGVFGTTHADMLFSPPPISEAVFPGANYFNGISFADPITGVSLDWFTSVLDRATYIDINVARIVIPAEEGHNGYDTGVSTQAVNKAANHLDHKIQAGRFKVKNYDTGNTGALRAIHAECVNEGTVEENSPGMGQTHRAVCLKTGDDDTSGTNDVTIYDIEMKRGDAINNDAPGHITIEPRANLNALGIPGPYVCNAEALLAGLIPGDLYYHRVAVTEEAPCENDFRDQICIVHAS